ncbi:MAG: M10 family metallopeptidase C-terminal domain-containing protein [Hyphomicrobiales bacterium]|nr:M10 family metallopeptidase C-terminal domain-containing protein [Rickettsiales bacterium]MCP5361378.1 M10 family metallopeptidase C-terminal domain-containing protein [Hyphomicrobiales bacterium]
MCTLCGHPYHSDNAHYAGENTPALGPKAIISDSNANYIDALLLGTSWSGTPGVGATVTYGVSGNPALESDTSAYLSAIKQAMARWSSVANINFNHEYVSTLTGETVDDKPLAFYLNSDSNNPTPIGNGVIGVMYADALVNSFTFSKVHVVVDDGYYNVTRGELTPGMHGFTTVMHEIGHAIGLDHPFEGTLLSYTSNGNQDVTLMAYDDSDDTATSTADPSTPMVFDIAAIQYLYGANTSTNAGNTTYTLTGTPDTRTIWDGGGNDTLDGSGLSTAARLDLTEGVGHYNLVGTEYVALALGANIENALGGSGNDTIYGNTLSNILTGGSGADSLEGDAGNDDMNGNSGNDTLQGGTGNDVIRGGQNDDSLRGGQDNDWVNGNMGIDFVRGDNGNDTVRGGADADTVYGGAGDDFLFGDKGNDILYGDSGADVFVFRPVSGEGNDTIQFFTASEGDKIEFYGGMYDSFTTLSADITFHSTYSAISTDYGTIIVQSSTALTGNDFIFS